MDIGLCSLWYNTPELLQEWERLLQPGGWRRAILVDNASNEESAAFYAASAARAGFEVMRMAENDVCKGWNAGMAALDTQFKVLMASDVIMVDPTWLQRLMRMVSIGNMAGPYVRKWVDGRTLYLDGCMIAGHTVDWQRLGGLDENFVTPGYCSDVDLSWRATQHHGMLLHQMHIGVLHLGNYTTELAPGQVHPTWTRNRDYLLRKMQNWEAQHGASTQTD